MRSFALSCQVALPGLFALFAAMGFSGEFEPLSATRAAATEMQRGPRADYRRTAHALQCCGGYLPLSLSFDGVLLFDRLSLGDGVVLDDDGGVLGVALLLGELDGGVEGVVAEDDGLGVDGVVVLGDIVDEVELGGVVVDGVLDVVLLSFWQPATPIAAAIARTAQGFRFM